VPDTGTSCGSRSLSIPDHSKARNSKPEGIEAIEGIWDKVANESAQKEIPGDGFDGCDAFAVSLLPTSSVVWRLDVWFGAPLAGGFPDPGTPGDCTP
jgi:hypothetical protein